MGCSVPSRRISFVFLIPAADALTGRSNLKGCCASQRARAELAFASGACDTRRARPWRGPADQVLKDDVDAEFSKHDLFEILMQIAMQ